MASELEERFLARPTSSKVGTELEQKLELNWKLLLDLKSIASDILRYIFEPAEWIRYIAIYFNLPSEYDTWPADKPPIYLQKSFISNVQPPNFTK